MKYIWILMISLLLLVMIFICSNLLLTTYEYFENNENNETLSFDNLLLTDKIRSPDFNNLILIDSIDSYKNNILIIDMPNLGGGTTFFINSIVSKYKNYTNFIIVRNFNNRLHVYVNDIYKLNIDFDDNESILFLNNVQPSIVKIFVNHTHSHSASFLNHIFTLNKPIATITHDFSLLFLEPHLKYEDIINKTPPVSIIDINKYDLIITQNKINTEIFAPFVTDHTKIITIPLPDYSKTNKYIINKSKLTNVGIIGNISDLKGANKLKELIKLSNGKFTIIIFGSTNFDYVNQYKYSNVNELNSLMIKHKPTMIIELSMWPETYSYTLTLAKIIGLPLLYLKKTFPSVIEDRLEGYSNAYSYSNIIKLSNDIPNKNQYFFNTINPTLYFNNKWNFLFTNNTNKWTN